jgi:hypothetical protein
MKLRKLNRALHRDLGYFLFGMTIIYALSGIALNHLNDWNPNYIIESKEVQVAPADLSTTMSKEQVQSMVSKVAPEEQYKNHFFPSGQLKIFVKDGSLVFDMDSGKGRLETSKKRPVFHQVNYLHYNPQRWWTYFSDFFAVGLLTLAITGLFILRGKQGITGRGAWLTIAGILIPVLFLILLR